MPRNSPSFTAAISGGSPVRWRISTFVSRNSVSVAAPRAPLASGAELHPTVSRALAVDTGTLPARSSQSGVFVTAARERSTLNRSSSPSCSPSACLTLFGIVTSTNETPSGANRTAT